MRKLTLFALLVLSINGFAIEPYYTWVDENGVRHYAQMKPRDHKAVLIIEERKFGNIVEKSKPRDQPPETVKARQAREQEEQQKKKAKEFKQEMERLNRDIAKSKAIKCEMSKRKQEALNLKNRVKVKQPDGTYVIVSYEEKQALIKENQKIIDNNC